MVSDQLSVNLPIGNRKLQVAGSRVKLRAIRDDDLAAIEAWYSEAATAAYEERSLEELCASARSDHGRLALVQPSNEEPIGLLEYRHEGEWLAIPFIALAKAYRGWGYGSEAVRLLEECAVRDGLAKRFWAEVPVVNGLGLYFWLRLGYRPEGSQDDRGWRTERKGDRMRMVRYANVESGKRG